MTPEQKRKMAYELADAAIAAMLGNVPGNATHWRYTIKDGFHVSDSGQPEVFEMHYANNPVGDHWYSIEGCLAGIPEEGEQLRPMLDVLEQIEPTEADPYDMMSAIYKAIKEAGDCRGDL